MRIDEPPAVVLELVRRGGFCPKALPLTDHLLDLGRKALYRVSCRSHGCQGSDPSGCRDGCRC